MPVRTNIDLDNYYKDKDTDISALFKYIVDPMYCSFDAVYDPIRYRQGFPCSSSYRLTLYDCINDDGDIQKDLSIEDVYSYVADECAAVNISPEIVIRFALKRFAEKMRQDRDVFASLVQELLTLRAAFCEAYNKDLQDLKELAILWRSLNSRQRATLNEKLHEQESFDFSKLKKEFGVDCDL